VKVRQVARPTARQLAERLAAFNARHPWSHNDHFHPWILRNLPNRRTSALDVGCGRGELLASLAPHFTVVHGTDLDREMRVAARERCAGLGNVTVDAAQLADLTGPYDLVTMVAVLHHLDVAQALRQVRRLLAPGGRLLVVGLARPDSLGDLLWDVPSMVANPLMGLLKHPRRASEALPAFPVRDPEVTFAALRQTVDDVLPGARVRRRLFFRHTIVWTQPV